MWAKGTNTNTEKTGQYLNPFKGWSAQECLTIFRLVNRFHFLMATLGSGKQSRRMESVFLPPPPHFCDSQGHPPFLVLKAACKVYSQVGSEPDAVFDTRAHLPFVSPSQRNFA